MVEVGAHDKCKRRATIHTRSRDTMPCPKKVPKVLINPNDHTGADSGVSDMSALKRKPFRDIANTNRQTDEGESLAEPNARFR